MPVSKVQTLAVQTLAVQNLAMLISAAQNSLLQTLSVLTSSQQILAVQTSAMQTLVQQASSMQTSAMQTSAMRNLSHAKLIRANLFGANLSRANLSNANLSNAHIATTIFFETNLLDSRNLESCKHFGPSNVDHSTIKISGMLPDIFLRGCGLPERLIEYYPSLLNQAISYYSYFISYNHDDKVFARRLHDQLQGRGIRCWLDEHQLLPGDDIFDKVADGIRIWDKVLLCASENSLNSWWVDNEIDSAFRKEQQLMKQRGKKVWSLIPLDLDGYMFSGEWENGKANQVKSRLAANFKGWDKDNAIFEAAFEKTVLALQAENAEREAPPEPKL